MTWRGLVCGTVAVVAIAACGDSGTGPIQAGLFTLVAGPDTISNLVQHLGQIAPKETVTLLNDSLQRLNDHPATSVVMTIVGFVIALWATTGAMNAFMTGLNIATRLLGMLLAAIAIEMMAEGAKVLLPGLA